MAEYTEEQLEAIALTGMTVEEFENQPEVGVTPSAPQTPRDRVLALLMQKNVITPDEFMDIASISNPDDDPDDVIALVAGNTEAPAKKISQALFGTEWEVSVTEVETRGAGMERFKNVAGTSWKKIWNTVTVPHRALWGEEGYYSAEAVTDRGDRTLTQKLAREELDRLLKSGDINENTHKRLYNLTGQYSSGAYQELIEGLNQAYDSIEGSIDEDTMEMRDEVMGALSSRAGVEEYDEETGGGEATFEQIDPETGEVTTVRIDPETGAVLVDDDIPDFTDEGLTDRLTDPVPIASYLSLGYVIDRASGTQYSTVRSRDENGNFMPSEWDEIHLDPVKQAAYIESKQIQPALQRILDSPQFAGQVDQSRGGRYDPETEEWIPDTGVFARQDRFQRGGVEFGPQIPIEDLAIASAVPTNPWEMESYQFQQGSGFSQWINFTPEQRAMRTKYMYDSGLITQAQYEAAGGWSPNNRSGNTGYFEPEMGMYVGGTAYGGDPFNLVLGSIWEQAVGLSQDFQIDPMAALRSIAQQKQILEATTPRGYGGSAPKYSVPASLRTVPDYKTLAQETKGIFSSQLGRDMEDWELRLLADELHAQYERYNETAIGVHKDWWDDSVAGGTTDIDFTPIETPGAALEFDVEEKYAAELDRYERVEDAANSRRVMMDSISLGRRMI